jgi:hypothetical protein
MTNRKENSRYTSLNVAGFSDRQFDEWLGIQEVDWNSRPSEEFQLVELLGYREGLNNEHTGLYNYKRYSKNAYFSQTFKRIMTTLTTNN